MRFGRCLTSLTVAELPQSWKNVLRSGGKAKTKFQPTTTQPASWVTSSGVTNRGETPVLDRKIRGFCRLLPQSWRFLRFSAVVAGQISTSRGVTSVCPGVQNHSGTASPLRRQCGGAARL